MVFLGLMAYFAFSYMRRSGVRMLVFVSIIVLVILMGASRVYLGAERCSRGLFFRRNVPGNIHILGQKDGPEKGWLQR
jgi:hypothetical protein